MTIRRWIGKGDGHSHADPANWEGGIVPEATDHVVIPKGSKVGWITLPKGCRVMSDESNERGPLGNAEHFTFTNIVVTDVWVDAMGVTRANVKLPKEAVGLVRRGPLRPTASGITPAQEAILDAEYERRMAENAAEEKRIEDSRLSRLHAALEAQKVGPIFEDWDGAFKPINAIEYRPPLLGNDQYGDNEVIAKPNAIAYNANVQLMNPEGSDDDPSANQDVQSGQAR